MPGGGVARGGARRGEIQPCRRLPCAHGGPVPPPLAASTEAPATSRLFRFELTALFAVFTVMSFGMSVVGPLLAEIHNEFGVSFAALGVMLAMPSVARVIFTLPSGYLADRFPPRAALSAGMGLLAVGTTIGALAFNFAVFLVAMLVLGLGTALVFTTGMAHAVRLAAPRRRGRAAARVMAGVQLGSFLSPAAGGVIASAFGWRAALLLAAGIGYMAVVMVWLTLRSPAQSMAASPQRRLTPAALGFSRSVLSIVAFSVLLWGATLGIKTVVLPLYGSVGLDLDPAGVGLVLSLIAGVRTVVMFAAGNLIDRFGRLTILTPSVAVSTVAALLLLLQPHLATYVVFGLLYAVGGVATALPPILVADGVPADRVGRAMGAMQFLNDSVLVGVPPLLGFLLDASGFGLVGLVVAGSLVASAAVGVRLLRAKPGDGRGVTEAVAAAAAERGSAGGVRP